MIRGTSGHSELTGWSPVVGLRDQVLTAGER